MQCNTLLLLVWWIALGLVVQYKGELVVARVSWGSVFYGGGGPPYIAAWLSFPAHLAGRDTTLVVGLAPKLGHLLAWSRSTSGGKAVSVVAG